MTDTPATYGLSTEQLLNDLAEVRSAIDLARLDYEAARQKILAPVQEALNQLEAEYAPMVDAGSTNDAELVQMIKANVLIDGASTKGDRLHAVYMRPRVSWDTAALDGYAVAHPEIRQMKREGEPSVAIRAVK